MTTIPSPVDGNVRRVPPATRCDDSDRIEAGVRKYTWLDSGTPGTR